MLQLKPSELKAVEKQMRRLEDLKAELAGERPGRDGSGDGRRDGEEGGALPTPDMMKSSSC